MTQSSTLSLLIRSIPKSGSGPLIFYEHGQEYGTGSASAYVTHADLTVVSVPNP